MSKLLGVLSSLLILTLSSCLTADPEVTVPSYIYVLPFEVDNSKSDIELFSEKISDVWVYLDNDNQGAYELPALIPLAATGNHTIELRPGIKNAGISTERRPYPYYSLQTLSPYKLLAGKIDTIKPITYYANDPLKIAIDWEEGFENIGPSYEINPESDTGVQIINRNDYPDLVFRGNQSGMIILEAPGSRFEMISPELTNLPRNNIPIYLEINYKSNQDFRVGLYRNNKTEQFPIYIVKAQEDWNKIYLDFSPYIQSSSPGSNFNVFIGFTRKSSVSRVEMYLDNIKLLHY
jgi:hypothetical protein